MREVDERLEELKGRTDNASISLWSQLMEKRAALRSSESSSPCGMESASRAAASHAFAEPEREEAPAPGLPAE